MKTIFVAGGSDERGEVAAAISMLRSAGWTITLDWPKAMETEPDVKSPEFLDALACQFENAIEAATISWVMLPKKKSEGAAYEMGFFRGLLRGRQSNGRALIVSGDASSLGRIYPYRAAAQGAMFRDHAEALEYLVRMT